MKNNVFLICMMKDDEPKLLHHWLKYYFDFLKIPIGEIRIHRTNPEYTKITENMLKKYNINIHYTDSYTSDDKNNWVNKIKSKYNENFWVVYPDSDEFFEYPDNDLMKFIEYCDKNKMTVSCGDFNDRHSQTGELSEIDLNKNIFEQYNKVSSYTKTVANASFRKVSLFKNKYKMNNSHFLIEEFKINNKGDCKKEKFKRSKQNECQMTLIMGKKVKESMNTFPSSDLFKIIENNIEYKLNIDQLIQLILSENNFNSNLFIIDLSIIDNTTYKNNEYFEKSKYIIEELFVKKNKNVIFIPDSYNKDSNLNEIFENICDSYLKPIIYKETIDKNFGKNLSNYLFNIRNFLHYNFNYYYPSTNVHHFKYTEYFVTSNTMKVNGYNNNVETSGSIRSYKRYLENVYEKSNKYYLKDSGDNPGVIINYM